MWILMGLCNVSNDVIARIQTFEIRFNSLSEVAFESSLAELERSILGDRHSSMQHFLLRLTSLCFSIFTAVGKEIFGQVTQTLVAQWLKSYQKLPPNLSRITMLSFGSNSKNNW